MLSKFFTTFIFHSFFNGSYFIKKITLGPRDVAQLVECVSSIHKLQDWPSAPSKLSALVQEARELKVTLNYTGSWKPVWAWTLDPVFDNEEMGRSFEYIKTSGKYRNSKRNKDPVSPEKTATDPLSLFLLGIFLHSWNYMDMPLYFLIFPYVPKY